jgi:hypothetical protein
VTLLRLWLIVSVLIVAGVLVWAFAPVLVFVLLLSVALGALSASMIALALALRTYLERKRKQR